MHSTVFIMFKLLKKNIGRKIIVQINFIILKFHIFINKIIILLKRDNYDLTKKLLLKYNDVKL